MRSLAIIAGHVALGVGLAAILYGAVIFALYYLAQWGPQ